VIASDPLCFGVLESTNRMLVVPLPVRSPLTDTVVPEAGTGFGLTIGSGDGGTPENVTL
jgi:hypothetical protein